VAYGLYLTNIAHDHVTRLTEVATFPISVCLMIIFLTNVVYNHVSHFSKFVSIFCPTVLWIKTKIYVKDFGGM
jgi:hypothetical protein